MNIFIVAMPGCGNLGDDLISYLLVKRLFQEYSPESIGLLCGKNNIYYYDYHDKIVFFKQESKKHIFSYFKVKNEIRKYIAKCDLIVIGGGGLLQDTHSPFTIYKYLKYNGFALKKTVLLGIGVGPIKYKFNRWYLRKTLGKDQIIQVRDIDSKDLLKNIGVKATIIVDNDIVEGSKNLIDFISFSSQSHKTQILGCNIRNWGDINIEKLVLFILQLVYKYDVKLIKFFVFENGLNNNSEKIFTQKIIKHLTGRTTIPIELFVYGEINNVDFYSELLNVTLGIASRYHANILWQLADIKTIPIVYSPKVKSLYSKYGLDAKTFDDLINDVDNYEFMKINLQDSNYKLPDYPSYIVNYDLFIKTINLCLSIISFIYELFNSIFIRLKYLLR